MKLVYSIFLFIPFLSMAQPPLVRYDNNIYVLNVGQAVTSIFPTNGGGKIPEIAYATTTTYAGSVSGFQDGDNTKAKFNSPQGIGIDKDNNLYVADRNNHRIRKITTDAKVMTVAGTGVKGFSNDNVDKASFSSPADVAVDSDGNIFVSELDNHTIRKIVPKGVVSTFAGSGVSGYLNGNGVNTKFSTPMGLAITKDNTLYVADRYNHRIRSISPQGDVATYVGSGIATGINGVGEYATFNNCSGVAVDRNGVLYIADYANNLIRQVNTERRTSTIAGCYCGAMYDGKGYAAALNNPYGIALGPDGDIFVAEFSSNIIRRISPDGDVTTLAGNGAAGMTNECGEYARFNKPSDVVVDTEGNVYVSDYGNHVIRKIISTGYTITPKLPAGLSFDSATGEISGTPLLSQPVQEYQITAYNKYGKSVTAIKLEVTETGNVEKTINNDLTFVLYPNPLVSGNKIRALLPNIKKEYCEVVIRDLLGHTLYREKCKIIKDSIEINFNCKSHEIVLIEIEGVGSQSFCIDTYK